jgi:hypothetical protein
VVSCDGKVPDLGDGDVLEYRGRMEITRLDDMLLPPCGGENGGRELPPGAVFGVIKMDVEGFEKHVLEGGRGFLKRARIPYIVFEIGCMPVAERQSISKFFYDLRYQASTWSFFDALGQWDGVEFDGEDLYLTLMDGGWADVCKAK